MLLKGRISLLELLSPDLPFGTVHELYRILFIKQEQMMKEQKEKEKEQKNKKVDRTSPANVPTYPASRRPADVNKQLKEAQIAANKSKEENSLSSDTDIPSLSPYEAEALEEAFEDMM